jgi:hypothetical protein
MLRLVALVGTDILEESIASIIKATISGELGTMSAVTSNWSTLVYVWYSLHIVFLRSVLRLLVTALFLARLFLSWWWRRYGPPKRLFLQQSGVTSQKPAFLIVTTVKTSILHSEELVGESEITAWAQLLWPVVSCCELLLIQAGSWGREQFWSPEEGGRPPCDRLFGHGNGSSEFRKMLRISWVSDTCWFLKTISCPWN